MTIDFNKPLLNLDKKPFVDENQQPRMMNKMLAECLSRLTKGELLKITDWAHKLWEGETLELDRADALKMKAIIEGFDNVWLIIKLQMVEVLEASIKNS